MLCLILKLEQLRNEYVPCLHNFVFRATKLYWDTLKIVRHHVYSKNNKILKQFVSKGCYFQEKSRIMEVELGLKITRTKDDTTSVSDFQFAKDRSGPVFLSKETDEKVILTAHLKGYKKENIEININKDGSEISISGEKEVQEMQMIPFKKEQKTKGFEKKFKIRDGVVLDRIKAKYNEGDEVLTIVMPKTEVGKGNREIEEVQEEPKASVADNVADNEAEESEPEKTEEETPAVEKPQKTWTPCPPLVFGGSTLLATLIFLVIHFLRARKNFGVRYYGECETWTFCFTAEKACERNGLIDPESVQPITRFQPIKQYTLTFSFCKSQSFELSVLYLFTLSSHHPHNHSLDFCRCHQDASDNRSPSSSSAILGMTLLPPTMIAPTPSNGERQHWRLSTMRMMQQIKMKIDYTKATSQDKNQEERKTKQHRAQGSTSQYPTLYTFYIIFTYKNLPPYHSLTSEA
ncbi:hypothetical protein VNO78_19665 [Psophocarpus tetragonolobus]|uniref:SHSP domain-containing protein n=1 Tax=Psophocarpus tetragonolobus TaxID=3891 RepID=A0AAN9XG13_PSOTE